MRQLSRLLQNAFASLLPVVEAGLVGWFFVSGLRYFVGAFVSQLYGSARFSVLDAAQQAEVSAQLGALPTLDALSQSLVTVAALLALPLVTVLVGRFRVGVWLAVAGVAAGRALLLANTPVTPLIAAALVVGAGAAYTALLARHRPSLFPLMFVFGFAADQIARAFGNTTDPTWNVAFINAQLALSLGVTFVALLNILPRRRPSEAPAVTRQGVLTLWSAFGLGALLFLELALLGLAGAVAGRTGMDYTLLVPLLLGATLLPLVPVVQAQAQGVISLFDAGLRGWAWLLLLAMLLVLGVRTRGLAAGVALVVAQFVVTLLWWWVVRPQEPREWNLNGVWAFVSLLVLALLAGADVMTYEYAYVQPLAAPLEALNAFVLPLLRGFRGLGFALLLLAALLAVLPMVQYRRSIPWRGGPAVLSLLSVALVAGGVALSVWAARPPLVTGVSGVNEVRVGTYNIHAGFNEFYQSDLEAIAQTIGRSGVNVVLLQEAEAGRLTSYGVHQPLWLARRLGMDQRYYPTVEGHHGLAVLSNVPIAYDDGAPLAALGQQTGLQRVQLLVDANVVLTVYNTWLGFLLQTADGQPIDVQQEQDQLRQLNDILAIMAAQHPDRLGRTVFGGTFNNIPDSPLIQRVRNAGFSDPFAGSPIETSATVERVDLSARIDYLWTYRVQPLGVGVLDSNASDHRLAFMNVVLTPGN